MDGKRVYDGSEFEKEQYRHRKNTVRKLRDAHGEIIGIMARTFEVG